MKRESTWKFRGNFSIAVEMREKFPKTNNNLIQQIMTSNHHLDIIHNWNPAYIIKLHFEIFEGSTREISTWKYPQGFYRGRRRKYPDRKISFISPEFPRGNHEENSAGMIPLNSPIKMRGNLGDVDGSPTGMTLIYNV